MQSGLSVLQPTTGYLTPRSHCRRMFFPYFNATPARHVKLIGCFKARLPRCLSPEECFSTKNLR